jgi:hypothetical protein
LAFKKTSSIFASATHQPERKKPLMMMYNLVQLAVMKKKMTK